MPYKNKPREEGDYSLFGSAEYLKWIKEQVTPSFMEKIETRMKKHFTEDLALVDAARKHSEHMALSGIISSAPLHFLDGAVENVFSCCGKNIEELLGNIAARSDWHSNLKEYNRIGVGIAIVRDMKKNYRVYVTQRLKPY